MLDGIEKIPDDHLFLSAVTIGEVQAGVEVIREQDPVKARELEEWLERLATSYGVLPMDAATFREWARLKHRKSATLIEDALIAATALVHRLMVVTINVRDFEMLGLSPLNPFNAS